MFSSDPQTEIAGIALIVSICSIILGVIALAIQRDHNRKSVKPICSILRSDYEDRISVRIKNAGVGPLIVEKISVINGSDSLIYVVLLNGIDVKVSDPLILHVSKFYSMCCTLLVMSFR